MRLPPFTEHDQRAFAEVSGDWNPIHMDGAVARYSSFGQVIVHGVHVMLRALEAHAAEATSGSPQTVERIDATFPRPIFLHDALSASIEAASGRKERISVTAGDAELAKVVLCHNPAFQRRVKGAAIDRAAHQPVSPDLRALEDMAGRENEMALEAPLSIVENLFPCSSAWLGTRALTGLVLLSTIIGMKWPGLLSLLSEIRVNLAGGDPGATVLRYKVVYADERYGLTKLEVSGPDFSAQIVAFFRPASVILPSLSEFAAHVAPGTFGGHCAWIIGGSRGLGATAAKLLVAGGARGMLTFHQDHAGTQTLLEEVRADSPETGAIQLDVTAGEQAIAKALADAPPPTMLLYFATPKIFRRRVEGFSRAALDEFTRFYIDGFLAVYNAAKARMDGSVSIFYPSTVALDTPVQDLLEYSCAKAAGEALCMALDANEPRMPILYPRLPRILTEQTNTIVKASAADAIETLLPILRQLADRSKDRT